MKNADKTAAPTHEATIDTASLENVTGGCAACGQPGHVTAPTTAPKQGGGFSFANLFNRR